MSDKVFIDTNVLIYAHDAHAGKKHETAAGLIRELWRSRTGTLSTQVLQEFYVNITRKIPKPLPRTTARAIIGAYQTWPVETIEPALILRASELEEQYQLSFWDALIVVAAQAAGVARILTEDLSPGQRIGGVQIENPFEA